MSVFSSAAHILGSGREFIHGKNTRFMLINVLDCCCFRQERNDENLKKRIHVYVSDKINLNEILTIS
jgi:hypothetical protein